MSTSRDGSSGLIKRVGRLGWSLSGAYVLEISSFFADLGERPFLVVVTNHRLCVFCVCSMVDAVDIATSHESVQTLVYFWYTGKLRRLMQSQGWCAWNNLETHKQILYLQGLIELSQLVSQWLIFDFQEHCNRLVLQHLERFNLHLGPPILRHAAACKQWDLVEMCANCIAPAYTHLRDTGAFENLDEDLKDVLRTAHVHLAFAELHLQPG